MRKTHLTFAFLLLLATNAWAEDIRSNYYKNTLSQFCSIQFSLCDVDGAIKTDINSKNLFAEYLVESMETDYQSIFGGYVYADFYYCDFIKNSLSFKDRWNSKCPLEKNQGTHKAIHWKAPSNYLGIHGESTTSGFALKLANNKYPSLWKYGIDKPIWDLTEWKNMCTMKFVGDIIGNKNLSRKTKKVLNKPNATVFDLIEHKNIVDPTFTINLIIQDPYSDAPDDINPTFLCDLGGGEYGSTEFLFEGKAQSSQLYLEKLREGKQSLLDKQSNLRNSETSYSLVSKKVYALLSGFKKIPLTNDLRYKPPEELRKDQFESSEDFKARLASYKKDLPAPTISYFTGKPEYDADLGAIVFNLPDSLRLHTKIDSKTTYQAQNAYGAQFEVTRWVEEVEAIKFDSPGKFRKESINGKSYESALNDSLKLVQEIKMDRNTAREIFNDLLFLIIVEHQLLDNDNFSIKKENISPTFDAPVHIYGTYKNIKAKIIGVGLINVSTEEIINFEYALSNEDFVKRERDQIIIDSIERLGI